MTLQQRYGDIFILVDIEADIIAVSVDIITEILKYFIAAMLVNWDPEPCLVEWAPGVSLVTRALEISLQGILMCQEDTELVPVVASLIRVAMRCVVCILTNFLFL